MTGGGSAVWAAHRPEADGVKAASACADAMSSTSTQPKPMGGTAGQFLPSMNFCGRWTGGIVCGSGWQTSAGTLLQESWLTAREHTLQPLSRAESQHVPEACRQTRRSCAS